MEFDHHRTLQVSDCDSDSTDACCCLSLSRGSQATWSWSLQIGVRGKCREDPACKVFSQLELCPFFTNMPTAENKSCIVSLSLFVLKTFFRPSVSCIKLLVEVQSRADAAGVSVDKRFLPFLCSGIDDDSSSLMQQKLERQVRKQTAVYVVCFLLLLCFLPFFMSLHLNS